MTKIDIPSRRANVANLRAKATTDDERWICDEFVRLFDAIERLQRADDATPYKEALHDLVQLRGEEWAIGGGPGFKDRVTKAWRAAEELFEP